MSGDGRSEHAVAVFVLGLELFPQTLSSIFSLGGLIRQMTEILRGICVPIIFVPKIFLQPYMFLVFGFNKYSNHINFVRSSEKSDRKSSKMKRTRVTPG